MDIKSKIITVLSIVTIILGYLVFEKPSEIIRKVPVSLEVTVPTKVGTFPPAVLPVPKKEKARPKLVEKFIKADSIRKDSLYADAVKERTYDSIYKNDDISITVEEIVQGKLLKRKLSYVIPERTVVVDTILDIPVPKYSQFRGRGSVGLPLLNPIDTSPVLRGGFEFIDKKNIGYSLEGDTKGYIWFGGSFKF